MRLESYKIRNSTSLQSYYRLLTKGIPRETTERPKNRQRQIFAIDRSTTPPESVPRYICISVDAERTAKKNSAVGSNYRCLTNSIKVSKVFLLHVKEYKSKTLFGYHNSAVTETCFVPSSASQRVSC